MKSQKSILFLKLVKINLFITFFIIIFASVVWKQPSKKLLKNLFSASLPPQSLGVFALINLMRKLFQCNESEDDFMEISKSSENTIYFDLDPLLTENTNNTMYLTFDDCRELIKELNFLMDKLG